MREPYKLNTGELVNFRWGEKKEDFTVVGFIGGGTGLVRVRSFAGAVSTIHRSSLQRKQQKQKVRVGY